ncbi:hypothetical protein L1887_55334 [Cichorium endivia]|nr:hypothetical protein L1887_55334 [Cichorium endivia]
MYVCHAHLADRHFATKLSDPPGTSTTATTTATTAAASGDRLPDKVSQQEIDKIKQEYEAKLKQKKDKDDKDKDKDKSGESKPFSAMSVAGSVFSTVTSTVSGLASSAMASIPNEAAPLAASTPTVTATEQLSKQHPLHATYALHREFYAAPRAQLQRAHVQDQGTPTQHAARSQERAALTAPSYLYDVQCRCCVYCSMQRGARPGHKDVVVPEQGALNHDRPRAVLLGNGPGIRAGEARLSVRESGEFRQALTRPGHVSMRSFAPLTILTSTAIHHHHHHHHHHHSQPWTQQIRLPLRPPTASADVVVDPSVSEPTSLPATTTVDQLPDATSQPQTHAAEPAQTTSLDPSEQHEQQASQPLLAATSAVDSSTAQTAPAPPTEPVPSIVEQPNVQELQQQAPATDTTHPPSAEAAPAQVAAQSTEPMSTSLPQASDTHAAEGLAAAPAADSATQPDLQVADAPQQAAHAPEVPSSATQEPASTTATALSEIAPAATADLSAPASDPTPSVVPQPEAAPASAQLPEPVAGSTPADASGTASTPKQAGDASSAPKEAPAQPEHPPTTASAVPAEAVPSLGESAPAALTDVPNPVEAPAASADSMAETAASASVPVDTALNTSAPQTPQKKAASEASVPSTPTREGRVALLLRINKELIRLCVELQAKQLVSDPVYREAAVRLQANLGYLAGIADKSGKNTDASRPTAPSAALPKLEPFPRSEHVPASPVAALAVEDEERKRAPSRGAGSQDVSAAGTPSSNPPDTQAVQTPSSQPIPQQPAPPGQDQGKGPDLSLAPPVPIVPSGGCAGYAQQSAGTGVDAGLRTERAGESACATVASSWAGHTSLGGLYGSQHGWLQDDASAGAVAAHDLAPKRSFPTPERTSFDGGESFERGEWSPSFALQGAGARTGHAHRAVSAKTWKFRVGGQYGWQGETDFVRVGSVTVAGAKPRFWAGLRTANVWISTSSCCVARTATATPATAGTADAGTAGYARYAGYAQLSEPAAPPAAADQTTVHGSSPGAGHEHVPRIQSSGTATAAAAAAAAGVGLSVATMIMPHCIRMPT